MPLTGWTELDQGNGVPKIESAYRWLIAGHQGSRYVVRAENGAPAALRRGGFAGPGDTLQTFTVSHADGLRAAQFLLTSDAPWLTVPPVVTSLPRTTMIPVRYRAGLMTAQGLYVATVTARSPTDSLAGALFTITSTVVVPQDLGVRALVDTGRVIAPGRVQRYFLRAPAAGASLRVTASVADPDDGALIQLYDPSSHPVSGDPDSLVALGYGKAPTVTIEVPAEDMPAGVYELDVFNPGINRTTVSVKAQLAAVALTPRDDGRLEASNPGAASVSVTAAASWAGAERHWDVAGRGAPAESLTVTVPAWAVRASVQVIHVAGPMGAVHRLRGDGVRFDGPAGALGGAQLRAWPADLRSAPARLVGQPVVVELFPGVRPDRHGATLAGDGSRALLRAIRCRRSGRRTCWMWWRAPAPFCPEVTVPPVDLPEGFTPLIAWRLTPAVGDGAAVVTFAPVAP